jgi:hypoxanthine phosphoribosyltransferase
MRLKLLMGREEIRSVVKRLAEEIHDDYARKNPLLVGVLKGSFVFLSDLVRALDMEVEVDFIRVISYGGEVSPGKKVEITKDIETAIRDREVLVVEDISDRGVTVEKIKAHLVGKNPKSVRFCAFLAREGTKVDYAGKVIEKGFVVGYGLDLREKYRNLPEVYRVEDKG